MTLDTLIADTNILIRLFTGEPQHQAKSVRTVFTQVERGEFILRIDPLVISETIYTLKSFYSQKPYEIARWMFQLIGSEGIEVPDRERMMNALILYSTKNVSFIDAYLGALATETQSLVLSFDKDFDHMDGVTRIKP